MADVYKVKSTHKADQGKVLFRTVSENRAKGFVEKLFPRGSEAYLEYPDGRTFHYEHERSNPDGTDTDRWDDFDPEAWMPPAEQPQAGTDEYADREG